MKDKSKIINATCDKESGVSRFCFQNKYGKFQGFAFCCEEDLDNFSQYAGSRYAEIRATIEFAKFRLKQEKIKLNTIKALLKDIEHSPKCENEPATLRKIKLKLRDYNQSVSDWENLCEYLKTSIKKQDEERQALLLRTKKDK